MKSPLLLLFFLSILSCQHQPKKAKPVTSKDRVTLAYDNNLSILQQYISELGISPDSFELHLRAYKAEALLEVWIKASNQENWILLKSYPFCTNSGQSGPKRKEGDLQIPEGFYHIDRFNPLSKFHLSLGINYPNKSDSKRGDSTKPGSDIFIHGGCQSVGCIAITDALIEQVYVLASEAKKQGQQKIEVRVFPCRMREETLRQLVENKPEHRDFWAELKVEDDYFLREKRVKSFEIGNDGAYEFEQ